MKKIYGVYGALFTILAFITVVMAQPTPPPDPWGFNGALFYDQSGITVPSTVTGGNKGVGTLNVGGFYIAGQQVTVATVANALKGNSTGSTAPMADVPVPGCDAPGSALTWTLGSGFSCNPNLGIIQAYVTGGGTSFSTGSCAPGQTSTGTTPLIQTCLASSFQTTSRVLADADGAQLVVWNGSSLTMSIPAAASGGHIPFAWATTQFNIGPSVAINNSGGSALHGCPLGLTLPFGGTISLQSDGTGSYNCQLTPPPFSWNRTVGGSSTTDTLSVNDCYFGVIYASSAGVAITVPSTLPANCEIKIVSNEASNVTFSFSGSGTLLNPNSFTKLHAQGSILTFDTLSNSDGTHALVTVNGDGA